MSKSFKQFPHKTALQIKLAMTDVDGTIAAGGEPAGPDVERAVCLMQEHGITVGLVSGRTLPELDQMARDLNISGPIIAENGAVARLNIDSPLVDLGYSRKPAMDALEKLKSLYPGRIKGRVDNKDRIIDVVFFSGGVEPSELGKHVSDIQLLDSGYVLHLMQAGISKGRTLEKILALLPDNPLSKDDVVVFGDSLTDLTLFELFSNGVLVPNPMLDTVHRQKLEKVAGYISDLPCERGFVEVVSRILSLRDE